MLSDNDVNEIGDHRERFTSPTYQQVRKAVRVSIVGITLGSIGLFMGMHQIFLGDQMLGVLTTASSSSLIIFVIALLKDSWREISAAMNHQPSKQ